MKESAVEIDRPSSPRHASAALQFVWWRLALLLPLLPAEILLLTLRFDAGQLAEETGIWAWLLVYSSRLLKAFLAAVAAVLLLGGRQMWRDGQQVVRAHPTASRRWLYLAIHALAIVSFAVLTGDLFEGDLLGSFPGLWVGVWCILGLSTFGTWLAALVPPSLWPKLAHSAAWPLLGGCATGLLAWGFGVATLYLWHPLAESTFAFVHWLLVLTGAEVISDVDTLSIGTPTFGVFIAPDCSGYEGIGLILVFLAAYLALFRHYLRFPHVLVLFPIGVILIWLANGARIALLILIGSAGGTGEAIALGGFHSQAGWLVFNALALGFVAFTTRVRFFQANTFDPADRSNSLDASVAYLAPWLTIMAVTLIIGAFSSGFDWLYPVRVVAGGLVLWGCRKTYGRWDGTWSWQSIALGVVVFGVWLLMAPAERGIASGPPAEWTEADPIWAILWLVFRIAGSVLTVPLAEELAFRGYLTRRLAARDFQQIPLGQMTWISFVVSSVLFGLLHGNCWPAGIVAGLLFAIALRSRGCLADAVAAHMTANALLCVYALGTGNWQLWN